MNTLAAMHRRRSIRKFRSESIPPHCLNEILDVARLYPSGGNLQPLRFALVTTQPLRDTIFSNLKWAMYLPGYSVDLFERPTAYILILRDSQVSKKCDYDVGAASTMIMLAATEHGLASCPLGSFNRSALLELLHLPEHLQPELVIALGYPAQESHAVSMENTVQYSQNENGDFLVPKRDCKDILVFSDCLLF